MTRIKTTLAHRWFSVLNRMTNGHSRAVSIDNEPSLRGKVMLVVLSTTCLALLLSAAALLFYEVRAYRTSRLNDLQTQADIIAKVTAPALSFKDPMAATENLNMLRLRPQITAAVIYASNGTMFSRYLQPNQKVDDVALYTNHAKAIASGEKFELYQPIKQGNEFLGTLYLRTDDNITGRLNDYVMILLAVMVASTAVAALITSRLQRAVTDPILQVAQVARDVMVHRNFSLRVPKTSGDEVGQLVDAFNGMLAEVAARTSELEESNKHLSIEMAERNKAEQALKEAARKKDEFLATLAHELRNPLAPISNAVEIIRRLGDQTSSQQQRALDIMSRQVKQMVRLIDDLLDVARITTGKLLLHKERVDLIGILHSALEIAAPIMQARHHTLDVRLPDHAVYINADPTRLAQVFANLLNNAAKYTSNGGLISLCLQTKADKVEVHIRDNGIGIAPQMQKTVFDMFVQVDQSLERGRAGLGVGLSLAKELTDLHGGDILVRSEGEQQGSEFIVQLPLDEQAASPAQPRFAEPTQQSDQPGLCVLVADDNVDFAVSLGQILDSMGHDVTVVHDGQSAIDQASRIRPDVVFLDIGMPGMSGHEVAQQLRRQADTSGAVLVAVTGWSQDKDRERSRLAGIDHHLAKPVGIQQLLPILAQSQARKAATRNV